MKKIFYVFVIVTLLSSTFPNVTLRAQETVPAPEIVVGEMEVPEDETMDTTVESTPVDDAEISMDSADAENPGMPWLDRATEEKLQAKNFADFGKVVDLCRRAKKEGLSGENLNYCSQLMAAAQLQRGLVLSRALIGKPVATLPKDWNAARIKILADLEEAVQVIKDQAMPFLRIAQLNLLPEGNAERAAEALEQAEKLAKQDPPILAEVLLLKAMLEKDPAKREAMLADEAEKNPDGQLLYLHALSLVDLNRQEEALAALRKILEKDPENVRALSTTYDVLVRLEKFDEALKVIDVLNPEGGNDALTLQKAKLLNQMKRDKEAIELLDELRKKHPENLEILYLRALFHLEMKEFDLGLKDVDAALRMRPAAGGIRTQLLGLKAQLLLGKEEVAEATSIVEELRKENPDNDGLTLLMVQLLSAQKKNRKAWELLEPVIEKAPENVALLQMKSQIMIALNRHSDAIKALEAVVKENPEDEVSLNNLSWLFSTSPIDMLRDGKRALELAEKACKLSDYKKAYILSTLAAAYAETGDFDKAVEWSQKSIDLSKEDENVSERVDDLRKELESYKKKQPYREALEETE